MYRSWTFAVALTGAALFALAPVVSKEASAEEGESLPPTTAFFEHYDQNADGTVTQDEFSGPGEVFRMLDKDKDGAISGPDLGLPHDYKPNPAAVVRTAKRARGKAPEGDPRDRARKARAGLLRAIAKMDADGDGRVSKDEWTFRPQGFDRLDKNRDGFIDRSELRRGAPGATGSSAEKRKQHFQRLDRNGDGSIDAAEATSPGMLRRFDADKDGKITLEEFEGGRGKGNKKRSKGKVRRRVLKLSALRRYDRDGNGDGKVSPDEYPASLERFKALDVDGDGFLTEKDIQLARDKPATKDAAKTSPFGSMDANGDGRLHRGEFNGSDDAWTSLDANQDGWLTPDEFKKGQAKPRAPKKDGVY